LVVKDHPKIMTDPAPYVIFKGASEGTLEFRLHFWTLFGDGYRTRSEIAVKMFTELRKAGIVIPYPKREIIFAKEESDLTESLKAHRKTKKDSKDETTE
jgi:small-conductance mechanosensitive channel